MRCQDTPVFRGVQEFLSNLHTSSYDISTARAELHRLTGGVGYVWLTGILVLLHHLQTLARLQQKTGDDTIHADVDAAHQALCFAVGDEGPVFECANRVYRAHSDAMALLVYLAGEERKA